MEYYSIKDAITEGIMIKVRLKCNLKNTYMQEFLRDRLIENNCVYLPYYMVECIANTDYMEIIEVLDREKQEEMEGSPEHVSLNGTVLYSALKKIENIHPIEKESKDIIKQMHLARAVKGSKELAETDMHRSYSKEEEAILRKGRIGWKGLKAEEK